MNQPSKRLIEVAMAPSAKASRHPEPSEHQPGDSAGDRYPGDPGDRDLRRPAAAT